MGEYAKAENGQLFLKLAGSWERVSGLYGRTFAMSLRASDSVAHKAQIDEIEAALKEIG